MKKNIAISVAVVAIMSGVSTVEAQTVTPKTTVTPTKVASASPTPVDKEVQKIKDAVASQISGKKKQAISGFVVSVKDSQITVQTMGGSKIEVKIDDTITSIYNITTGTKKEVKKDTLAKDDYVVVSGPQIDNSITANTIYVDQKYEILSGKVAEVNKTDFTMKVVTSNKENYTLEVQTRTKQNLLNSKTLAIEKTGFSKLKEGDTIHFTIKKIDNGQKRAIYDVESYVVIPQEYFLK